MQIVALAEQPEHVFFHWQLTGIHRGHLLSLEPTGKNLLMGQRRRLGRSLLHQSGQAEAERGDTSFQRTRAYRR